MPLPLPRCADGRSDGAVLSRATFSYEKKYQHHSPPHLHTPRHSSHNHPIPSKLGTHLPTLILHTHAKIEGHTLIPPHSETLSLPLPPQPSHHYKQNTDNFNRAALFRAKNRLTHSQQHTILPHPKCNSNVRDGDQEAEKAGRRGGIHCGCGLFLPVSSSRQQQNRTR